jgi:hypothetical protein
MIFSWSRFTGLSRRATSIWQQMIVAARYFIPLVIFIEIVSLELPSTLVELLLRPASAPLTNCLVAYHSRLDDAQRQEFTKKTLDILEKIESDLPFSFYFSTIRRLQTFSPGTVLEKVKSNTHQLSIIFGRAAKTHSLTEEDVSLLYKWVHETRERGVSFKNLSTMEVGYRGNSHPLQSSFFSNDKETIIADERVKFLFVSKFLDLIISSGEKLTPMTLLALRNQVESNPAWNEWCREKGLLSTFANNDEADLWELIPEAAQFEATPSICHGELYVDFMNRAYKSVQNFIPRERPDWYQTLVKRNPILNAFEEIEEEVYEESSEPFSHKLTTFLSIWLPGDFFVGDLPNIKRKHLKRYFSLARSEASEALLAFQKNELDKIGPFVAWFHGTNSGSLPGVFKAGRLLPGGQILDRPDIVSFSGEWSGRRHFANERNANHISAVPPSSKWTDAGAYYGARTRYLMALLYANKTIGWRLKKMVFNEEECREFISDIFLQKPQRTHEDNLHLELALKRLLAFDSLINSEIAHLAEVFKQSPLDSRFLEIIKARDQLLIPEEQRNLILNPFPIVMASTIKGEDYERRIGSDEIKIKEILIKNGATLGDEIEIAFTAKEHIESLTKQLKPYGIQVYSFATGKLIETSQMIQGSKESEFLDSLRGYEPSLRRERYIAYLLEQDIFPWYKRTLPEIPQYREIGQKEWKKVDHPNFGGHSCYNDYIKGVKQGVMAPRRWHGRLHAARTALWAELLQPHLINRSSTQYDESQQMERIYLTVAAAAHDWRRQDEGVDRWDEESGKALHAYLLARSVHPKLAADLAFALKKKDPEGGVFTHDYQRVVHDADCLEIMRCLKNCEKNFRKSELYLMNVESIQHEGFLTEILAFIRETESPAIATALEFEEEDIPYFSKLLGFLRDRENQYPILNRMLIQSQNG